MRPPGSGCTSRSPCSPWCSPCCTSWCSRRTSTRGRLAGRVAADARRVPTGPDHAGHRRDVGRSGRGRLRRLRRAAAATAVVADPQGRGGLLSCWSGCTACSAGGDTAALLTMYIATGVLVVAVAVWRYTQPDPRRPSRGVEPMTSTTGRSRLARPLPYASPDVAMLGGAVRYVGNAQAAVTELVADDYASHRRRFGPRPHTIGGRRIGTDRRHRRAEPHRSRRRPLPRRGEVAGRPCRRVPSRRRRRTAPKANRSAARTRRCWNCVRTSSSTGWPAPPRPSARTTASSGCTRVPTPCCGRSPER